MKAGKTTPPKEQLDDWSLIKWEKKKNPISYCLTVFFNTLQDGLEPLFL